MPSVFLLLNSFVVLDNVVTKTHFCSQGGKCNLTVMKKKYFLLLAFWLSVLLAQAQYSGASRVVAGLDAGMAFGNKNFMPSIQFYQLLKIDSKGLFQAGFSFRATQFVGKDINFLGKNDTLQMNRASLTALNFGLKAQLSLKFVQIGASVDLFGLAIGGKRTGYYLGIKGLTSDSLNVHRTYQPASPATGNVAWFGGNSLGHINADVYVRVWLGQYIGLKAGYLFNATQYKTTATLLNDNRRFRFQSQMIYVGLSFPIDN